MEPIIKQTRAVGTSAGVLLPRSWLNKKVVVSLEEKSKQVIIKDVIEILSKHNLLEDVKGIYLVGSYARGDYDLESDVDILVITENENKLIADLDYEIVLISEKNLLKNIQKSVYNLTSIKESETLLNEKLIEKYKDIKLKINLKEYIAEIKSILNINREVIDMSREANENVPDPTIYSLVLRLRELYLIKSLIKNKVSGKNQFLKYLKKEVYEAYLRVKRNNKEINNISVKEATELVNLIEKWLKEIRD